MAICEATVDDVDAIQRVARESWTQDYPDVLSRESLEEGLDDWYSEERIRDSIAWSQALMLVAEPDDEIVGFTHATWDANADEGNILRVYVEPGARGEGIGGRLLEETCQSLFYQGLNQIKAMVLEENELGKSFYDEFGFEKAEIDTVPIGDDTYEECTYVLDRESFESDIETL